MININLSLSQSSVESIEGGSYFAEDNEQPLDVRSIADVLEVEAFQQKLRDYLDDLTAFIQERLAFNSPCLNPLFLG